MNYDVFNGDADGICSLLQLRKAEPREATLVTGVKRDIDLLEKVNAAAGDRITVLDVSLDKNRGALDRALAAGALGANFPAEVRPMSSTNRNFVFMPACWASSSR